MAARGLGDHERDDHRPAGIEPGSRRRGRGRREGDRRGGRVRLLPGVRRRGGSGRGPATAIPSELHLRDPARRLENEPQDDHDEDDQDDQPDDAHAKGSERRCE
jgi:hypothetical protein